MALQTGWQEYRNDITVVRVTSSSMYIETKAVDSSQPPTESVSGLRWEKFQGINGKETLVEKPFDFPIRQGKTWEVEFLHQHPSPREKYVQWSSKYTVVGYETVQTPAGTFNAVKVEMEGRWTMELEPTQTTVQGLQTSQDRTAVVSETQRTGSEPITGRTYGAYWYAPEVKRWVKAIREKYSSTAVRAERTTAELQSYKVNSD